MHITFVIKRKADGSTCGKCEDVQRRLERDGHLRHIDTVAVADVTDPDSPGMVLATTLGVENAPFFVVSDGEQTTVYTIYLKFVREVLQARLGAG